MFKLNKYNYSYAETLFDKIDNEEKAYWLGFLYADGYIDSKNNVISLALKEEDLNHIKKFRSFFKLENKKIHKKTKNIDYKSFISYEFSICNKKVKEQLIKLKCVPRKTSILKFPSKNIVPNKYLKHFIRGYIDGDGSITRGNTSIIILDVLGTEDFLNGYQKWTKLHQNKLHRFKHTDKVLHSMYGGIAAIYILDEIYKDAHIYLERKYKNYLLLRRLRLKTIKRPKSIMAEFSKKGLSKPNLRLKALLKEVDSLQQCK